MCIDQTHAILIIPARGQSDMNSTAAKLKWKLDLPHFSAAVHTYTYKNKVARFAWTHVRARAQELCSDSDRLSDCEGSC